MRTECETAKSIIEWLTPHGIHISTGFDSAMGFEIRATKCFSLSSTDYISLLADPRIFAKRVKGELGMLHNPKRVIQRVSNINSDYWVSSPSARRRK